MMAWFKATWEKVIDREMIPDRSPAYIQVYGLVTGDLIKKEVIGSRTET